MQSHISHKQHSTNGLSLLFKEVEGFSQAQAAWRFFNNESVDIASLNRPLLEGGIEEIEKQCDEYVLAAYDWSHLDYRTQYAKKECVQTKRSKTGERKSIGYDLQSTLAISDKTGSPITPLAQNMKTEMKVYSTYRSDIDQEATHLEELFLRTRYTHKIEGITKKIVDIIDREGDSVALMRQYAEYGYFYIIRANNRSKVAYDSKEIAQKDLAQSMSLGEYVKKISYKNKEVSIYVNEVAISITRAAYQKVKREDGSSSTKRVKGKEISMRFIVERLVNKEGEIVATWMLLSNLPKDVSSQKIGLWYYYRWNIESYFKLLKSSGFNLEKWQQREPLALFKRLLIASYACVLVWKIEHDNTQRMQKIKALLVKLSGRLIQRGKVSTSPALLAGLWNYFNAMDMIEIYGLDELYSIRDELRQFMGLDGM